MTIGVTHLSLYGVVLHERLLERMCLHHQGSHLRVVLDLHNYRSMSICRPMFSVNKQLVLFVSLNFVLRKE